MPRPGIILVADNNRATREMIHRLFPDHPSARALRFMENGSQLLEYLEKNNPDTYPIINPLPGIILINQDTNAQKEKEVIRKIKSDPRWRSIPVIVLAGLADQEEARKAYLIGVNSYIVKPACPAEINKMFTTLFRYWLEMAKAPGSA